MEYTKGEWKVDPDCDWVRREDGRVIANCTGYERDEQRANAHLIASAPELYEACKALIEHMTTPKNELGRPYLADVKRMAHKAIAKAEGKDG